MAHHSGAAKGPLDAVAELRSLSRSFGATAVRTKARLLQTLAAGELPSSRRLRILSETLDFMRAYPDDVRVLRGVRTLIARLPDVRNVYSYTFEVVERLVRLSPGRLEIAWDDLEDEARLLDVLEFVVLPGEAQGAEDVGVTLREWFASCRTPGTTDLEFLVALLESSCLPPEIQTFAFEACDLPIRYDGPASCRVEIAQRRVHFQRRELERGRRSLRPVIRAPLPRPLRAGRRLIDVALRALAARCLEIYPLIYANPADAVLVSVGRGVQIGIVGVLPERRSPLETLVFFLILKNGAPVAYGPAAVFCGCCELGVNLFPEFRGGEIRFLYAQLLRVLHHRLGADCFLLTRYAMGEDNPEAIASGAFWFYRKLGFRAESAKVEALAREEEARMEADPGHRSDRRTLHRLARTRAILDLSGGKHAPFDFGRLGMAESRFIAAEFRGDRALARRRCAARAARVLGVDASARAVQTLGPLLAMLRELPRWPTRDRALLARILRAKDATSEAGASRLLAAHERLAAALREL